MFPIASFDILQKLEKKNLNLSLDLYTGVSALLPDFQLTTKEVWQGYWGSEWRRCSTGIDTAFVRVILPMNFCLSSLNAQALLLKH